MEKDKKYNTEEFYVGELYLYTNFANFILESYDQENNAKVNAFPQTGAINFQQNQISRYIDWENGREYIGFLTIFYKQGDKYLCLHDGVTYEVNGANYIKNLLPLSELLPKINTRLKSEISTYRALELFDVLFKKNSEEQLYTRDEHQTSDFFIGDLILKEIEYSEAQPDNGYNYINLPYHVMLNKLDLAIQSFQNGSYANTIYRCLFLRDGMDLFNVNNHQFYNPNEDTFQSIINFQDYITKNGIQSTAKHMSIPKALKLFKKTI